MYGLYVINVTHYIFSLRDKRRKVEETSRVFNRKGTLLIFSRTHFLLFSVHFLLPDFSGPSPQLEHPGIVTLF